MKKKLKVSFIIYGNFEYILKPLIDNNVNGPSNEKYQDFIVCSYVYKLIYIDEQYSNPY